MKKSFLDIGHSPAHDTMDDPEFFEGFCVNESGGTHVTADDLVNEALGRVAVVEVLVEPEPDEDEAEQDDEKGESCTLKMSGEYLGLERRAIATTQGGGKCI